MSTTSNRIVQNAKEVTEGIQKTGAAVTDAAQETLQQVGDRAVEYFEQGRAEVHGAACACEQFIRQRPIGSALMAAGIGWLLGRFWKHR